MAHTIGLQLHCLGRRKRVTTPRNWNTAVRCLGIRKQGITPSYRITALLPWNKETSNHVELENSLLAWKEALHRHCQIKLLSSLQQSLARSQHINLYLTLLNARGGRTGSQCKVCLTWTPLKSIKAHVIFNVDDSAQPTLLPAVSVSGFVWYCALIKCAPVKCILAYDLSMMLASALIWSNWLTGFLQVGCRPAAYWSWPATDKPISQYAWT